VGEWATGVSLRWRTDGGRRPAPPATGPLRPLCRVGATRAAQLWRVRSDRPPHKAAELSQNPDYAGHPPCALRLRSDPPATLQRADGCCFDCP